MSRSRRHERLAGELSVFVQQYGRKAQRGVEPNDRHYSRKVEDRMKRLHPEELSALLAMDGGEVTSEPRVTPRAETRAARSPGRRG
jgi:hypothetical protein